jgi:hypothetical protein
LRQPFLEGYYFPYFKESYNADIIHELGMYVGNSQFIGNKHMNLLNSIVEKVAKNVEN